jgi:glucokinase
MTETSSRNPDAYPALIADIGGTNARFALMQEDGSYVSKVLQCADYRDVIGAARAFLETVDEKPRHGAFCVATAVTGDRVSLTNNSWSFSIEDVRQALELGTLQVVNDFTAVAMSMPFLQEKDRRQIGGGRPLEGAPVAVVGPGTGLGVSGLVPFRGRWISLAGEGGHATFSPATEREAAITARLRRRFDHVSFERVLSGMGLVNLYEGINEIDGHVRPHYKPHEITEQALAGADPAAREALELFCSILGNVAGNVALTLGARGGVFIGGGIPPRLGSFLDDSPFRARFVSKGRLSYFLEPIPTYLITHELPAFVGLRGLLEQGPDQG